MLHPFEIVREASRRVARLGDDVVPGTVVGQAIDIDRIIFPLRYDICIRVDFLRLLRDEERLYEDDLDAFLNLPAAQAYFTWFRDVRCFTYRPRLLHDVSGLKAAFVRRVRQTAELWQSVERNGFDNTHPIRLASGRSIENVNGKVINSTVFAGDGCHRIACLHLFGYTHLEPTQYEVAIQARLKPFDNTATLIAGGALNQPAYVQFISQFYCDGEDLGSPGAIYQYVAHQKPELLPELESVFAHDLVRLGRPGVSRGETIKEIWNVRHR